MDSVLAVGLGESAEVRLFDLRKVEEAHLGFQVVDVPGVPWGAGIRSLAWQPWGDEDVAAAILGVADQGGGISVYSMVGGSSHDGGVDDLQLLVSYHDDQLESTDQIGSIDWWGSRLAWVAGQRLGILRL